MSYILYPLLTLIPHYLYQISYSPHSIGRYTDAVAKIVIACLFHRVGHRHSRRYRYRIQYAREGRFLCWASLGGRQIWSHFSEPTVAILPGMGYCRKFLIPPFYPLFPTSTLSQKSPQLIPAPHFFLAPFPLLTPLQANSCSNYRGGS